MHSTTVCETLRNGHMDRMSPVGKPIPRLLLLRLVFLRTLRLGSLPFATFCRYFRSILGLIATGLRENLVNASWQITRFGALPENAVAPQLENRTLLPGAPRRSRRNLGTTAWSNSSALPAGGLAKYSTFFCRRYSRRLLCFRPVLRSVLATVLLTTLFAAPNQMGNRFRAQRGWCDPRLIHCESQATHYACVLEKRHLMSIITAAIQSRQVRRPPRTSS